MIARFGPGGNGEAFRLTGGRSTVEAPRWLKDFGLNAYEYEAGNGLSASAETLRLIGDEGIKHGIKLSYHTPYFISLSGVVPETRLKSIGYIEESVYAARLLRADTIVVHTGSAAKITRDEAMRLAADTLIRTLSEVDTSGIRIGLETMGKKNQLGTLDEVLELCRIDSALHPVIDFGHLNARDCGGVFKTSDDYLRVFEKIEKVLGVDYCVNLHCHFSRIEWTDKGEKKHLTFADDQYGPPYRPLVEAIERSGFAPTVICESAGTQAEDALLMKKYYEEIKNE